MATPKKRQFTWTTVPSGRIRQIDGIPTALFSVLLTPRLTGPPGSPLKISDFGLQEWPSRLARAEIAIFREGTRIADARRVPHFTADGREIQFARDAQLTAWRALFPPTTPVHPVTPTSYKDRPIREFPSTEAGTTIKNAYASTVRLMAIEDAGIARQYANGADPGAADRQRRVQQAIADITSEWQAGLWPHRADDGTLSPAAPSPLRQAYDFYRRDSGFTHIAPKDAAAEAPPDFHDIVARLADHPILLRVLGLLLDFGAPAAQLGGATSATIQAVPRWPSGLPDDWYSAQHEDLSPRSAYGIAGLRFLPSAAGAPPGLLPLAGADLAGKPSSNARFEIMPFDVDGAALRMVNAAESDRADPSSTPSGRGLPALRSVGFALIEKTRNEEHKRRLQRAAERSSTSGLLGTPLSADNLNAGYRLDIFDTETSKWYSLCQRRVQYTIGNIKIGAEPDSGGVKGILEEGCVRPDSVTTGAGANDALFVHQTIARWDGWSLVSARPERVLESMPVQQPYPVSVDADVEIGSLPRLRFGREYVLRARIADVAGGGLRATEVGTEQSTATFMHRRHEPIPPPALVPTRAFTDGEGQGQMLIRSDRGVSVASYSAVHGYRPADQRHLLAPKCSLEMALQHELLNGGFNAAMGPAAADSEVRRMFAVAARADRDLADITPTHLHQDGVNSGGTYVVAPGTAIDLPWLADPASLRVAVRMRERLIDPNTGSPGAVRPFDPYYTWRGTWSDFVPMTLNLAAADAGCQATMEEEGQRLRLTVTLGPAEQVTLDISSCPHRRDIAANGLAIWAGANPLNPQDPITAHVEQGRSPLVSPPLTVTMVHAVQRPLGDPSGTFHPERQAADTQVTLATHIPESGPCLSLHVASTGRIDIGATWTDLEDIPGRPPAPKPHAAAVGSYDVEHVPLFWALKPIRHELTDTRRRRVVYTVTAISRFRDYFGSITSVDPNACTVTGVLRVTDVPSSARPPAPALRYLMPLSRWTREGGGTSVIRSVRRGGGVRVFLERPWFASGEDEKLAVLVWPQSTSASPAVLRTVSVAGKDPIWTTDRPPAALNPSHFYQGEQKSEFLPELGYVIAAMTHSVAFDAELDCWCADIDLSPLVASSYFPFVRLGLSRYQENTVKDVPRLSQPIICEPLQLLPSRSLTVRRTPGRAGVLVEGLGPGNSPSNALEIELQAHDAAAPPEDALTGPAGWRTIARKTSILGSEVQIDVPLAASRRLRISVSETEIYPAPASAGASTSRLVYVDNIDITA